MQMDIIWEKFELNNPNKKPSFEKLCRLLFKHELCLEGTVLVSESNHLRVKQHWRCQLMKKTSVFNRNILIAR